MCGIAFLEVRSSCCIVIVYVQHSRLHSVRCALHAGYCIRQVLRRRLHDVCYALSSARDVRCCAPHLGHLQLVACSMQRTTCTMQQTTCHHAVLMTHGSLMQQCLGALVCRADLARPARAQLGALSSAAYVPCACHTLVPSQVLGGYVESWLPARAIVEQAFASRTSVDPSGAPRRCTTRSPGQRTTRRYKIGDRRCGWLSGQR